MCGGYRGCWTGAVPPPPPPRRTSQPQYPVPDTSLSLARPTGPTRRKRSPPHHFSVGSGQITVELKQGKVLTPTWDGFSRYMGADRYTSTITTPPPAPTCVNVMAYARSSSRCVSHTRTRAHQHVSLSCKAEADSKHGNDGGTVGTRVGRSRRAPCRGALPPTR